MLRSGVGKYLVHHTIGKKQLFARQATKPKGQTCWCLHQVEKSFPDSLRVAFTGKSYKDQLNWIKELNDTGDKNECPAVECGEELAPTPQGSVPGMW